MIDRVRAIGPTIDAPALATVLRQHPEALDVLRLIAGDVAFKLLIPGLPVILGKPIAKRRQFLGCQFLDFALEGFDLRRWNR